VAALRSIALSMPSESDRALAYLILGATGSGRRELVADLVEGGLAADESAAVLVSEHEEPDPSEGRLAGVARWRWTAERRIEAPWPAGKSRVFFIADGRSNPVDQVEAFKAWLSEQPAALGRIISVVDCRLAQQHPPLRPWFDACVHFSDVVLFNRREGLENKWMSDFLGRFHDQRVPALFETVKAGRVANPALILEPQARRLSLIFDEEPAWAGVEIGGDEDEEGELVPEEDIYLARHNGSGRRVRELPDITKYLGPRAK
jgi:hypothetical protein